jgi:hypothetical protein
MRAYSAVSNNRDASEDTRRYFISRARGLLIVFLILGVFIGPQMLEPKDVVECEPVTVMSYHQGSVVSALRSPLMVLIRCGRSVLPTLHSIMNTAGLRSSFFAEDVGQAANIGASMLHARGPTPNNSCERSREDASSVSQSDVGQLPVVTGRNGSRPVLRHLCASGGSRVATRQ